MIKTGHRSSRVRLALALLSALACAGLLLYLRLAAEFEAASEGGPCP